MHYTGIVRFILEGKTTSKGSIQKSFVIETEGEYPKMICFSMYDKQLPFSIGDKVDVHFDLSSNNWNDKWYTNAKAWKVEVVESVNKPQPQPEPTPPSQTEVDGEDDDGLPF